MYIELLLILYNNKTLFLGSVSPTYLRTAFTPVAPKSIRIKSSCHYLFTLLGSTGAKSARRMLMKLTPGGEIDEATFPFLAHYVSSIYLLDQTLTYVYDRPYNTTLQLGQRQTLDTLNSKQSSTISSNNEDLLYCIRRECC
jgi:hypothetical protein